ncbi:hypothetical protein PHAVU_008G041400 [Phaseolus vulgaris]|uniref:ZF-HD dimerization-type domain-containing protein n=1 Tax=Phaseolus vulgaris TaxID=3885 RepID=V7B0Z4_PHAVU|nr:hypothetical protein PHAVU_008G041400g [Phaseolus vulgaris]ESW11572.1 hypothetical protein PHAVU_008G041400g [Phaseolus vulgaris]
MSRVILRTQPPRECPSSNMLTIVRNVQHGECQRNHAVHVGGLAQDGCMEFIPSGAEETDEAMMCAGCGCHRNFHRREIHIHVVCHCPSRNG